MSKLLWIDDDGRLLERQVRWLSEAGFHVQVASTVDAAWSLLTTKQAPFDGIILDMMMGTGALLSSMETSGGLKTGKAFLQKLAKEDLMKDKNILVYTASSDRDVEAFCSSVNVPIYLKIEHPGKAIAAIAVEVFGRPQRGSP